MIQRMMMLAALGGVLAAPACLQAQAGKGAPAAPAEIFNKLLSAEEKDFVSAADAMPADKFNYAPTTGEFKGVRTFADQVKHVTQANYLFFGDWNVPNGKNPADIGKLSGKAEIMDALRQSFSFEHAALGTLSAGNLLDQTAGNRGTRLATATHALAHLMDHYGQMVEYLRMNGIVPPASRKPGM